jgi:hypothetical protein
LGDCRGVLPDADRRRVRGEMKFPTLPRSQVALFQNEARGLWQINVRLFDDPKCPWLEYCIEPTLEAAKVQYEVLTGVRSLVRGKDLEGEGDAAESQPNARAARSKTPWNWR